MRFIKKDTYIMTCLRFMQVYIRLDQPMAALEVYRTGLDKFPNEVTFLTGVARIYEAIGNLSLSAKYYKILLVVRVPCTLSEVAQLSLLNSPNSSNQSRRILHP